ncbi:MAG: DUF3606 domain-containing protein [Rubrivivax sp.]|nr:MAG: DUF3606 domain-containing protein [Rubrivivax sp.]
MMNTAMNSDAHHDHHARIDVRGIYERQAWAKVFNVSRDELMAAVKAVGTKADDVATYLSNRFRRHQAMNQA